MHALVVEETRAARWRLLFIGLGIIGILYLIVFVLPMLYMVAISVGEGRLATEQFEFDGPLAAYERFWSSGYYRGIMLNSLRLAGWAVVLTALIGMPLAYTAVRGSRLYRTVTLIAVINPLFVSTIVRAFGLDIALSKVDLDGTFIAVLVGTVQILLPFMVIPMMSGFRDIDPLTVHSARTLGSGRIRIALRIVLPILVPYLLAGGVIVFILAMNIFSIPLILGKPEDPTVALVVYQSALTHANYTYAAAVAFILLAMSLTGIFLQNRLARSFGRGVV